MSNHVTPDKVRGDEEPMAVGMEICNKLGEVSEKEHGLKHWEPNWSKIVGAVVSWVKDQDEIKGTAEEPDPAIIVDKWFDYLDEKYGRATVYFLDRGRYHTYRDYDGVKREKLEDKLGAYLKQNDDFRKNASDKWREVVPEFNQYESEEGDKDEQDKGGDSNSGRKKNSGGIKTGKEKWRERQEKQKITGWTVDDAPEEKGRAVGSDSDDDTDDSSVDNVGVQQWDGPKLIHGDPLIELEEFEESYDFNFDCCVIPCRPYSSSDRVADLLGVVKRVSKDGAVIFLDLGVEPVGVWRDEAEEAFEVLETVVWDTGRYGLGHTGKDTPQFRRGAKFLLMCSNGEPQYTNSFDDKRNILEVADIDEENKRHPEEKPTALLDTLITSVTPVDGAVLAPYDYGAQVAYTAAVGNFDYLSITERKEDSKVLEMKMEENHE